VTPSLVIGCAAAFASLVVALLAWIVVKLARVGSDVVSVRQELNDMRDVNALVFSRVEGKLGHLLIIATRAGHVADTATKAAERAKKEAVEAGKLGLKNAESIHDLAEQVETELATRGGE
jgi:large-conductance mechanosensitive channel